MKSKKKLSFAIVMILVLSLSISIVSFAAVRIRFSGTQTMATNCSRRIYVTGAGSRTVKVTASSGAVTIRKDSKSYIVTGKKSGSAYVTVRVGSIKKRIHTVVLTDKQIAQRVCKRVKAKYSSSSLLEYYRRGNVLNVMLSKPQGDGAPTLFVKVNLSTGRAVCDSGWDEFFSRVPKSFKIW